MGRDEDGNLLIHPTRFPNGLKSLVVYNVTGIYLGRFTADEIKKLSKGMYFMKGRKVYISSDIN